MPKVVKYQKKTAIAENNEEPKNRGELYSISGEWRRSATSSIIAPPTAPAAVPAAVAAAVTAAEKKNKQGK